MNLFLHVEHESLYFTDVNALSAETLDKSERGEDLHRFDNAGEMFEDLGM